MTRTLIKNASNVNPPNFIINGGFDFWQRGSSGTLSSSVTYIADRICHEAGNAPTGQRSTDAPGFLRYSLQIIRPAGGIFNVGTRLEGANTRLLVNKKVTFSMWAKIASGTGAATLRISTPSASLDTWDTSNIGGALVSSTAITITNTWQKFSITADLTGANTHLGLECAMFSSTVPAGVDIFTTGWMLTEGIISPVSFYRAGSSLADELVLCQRYYEKSYDLDIVPGVSANAGNYSLGLASGITNGNTVGTINFKVTKRAQPTVTVYSGSTGTADRIRYNGADLAVTSNSNNGINSSIIVNNTGGALATGSVAATCQYTASAEL